MIRAKGTVEPEKYDGDKRGKIPLVQVFGKKEESIKGKIESGRMKLESSLAGTGPDAPGQLRLSSGEMKRTTIDCCTLADGGSEHYGTIYLHQLPYILRRDIAIYFKKRVFWQ